MAGDDTEKALTRIEAALLRIERAAARPRPVADAAGVEGALAELATAHEAHADLSHRHDALRGAVSETLAHLDALIADQETRES